MATVRSLVCWGGRTGKSVTASNSGGLIFTSTNHGLRDGTALMFSGTTLPGNVSSIVPYYTQSLSANTFAIYTEPELTNRVAWSSAGSGVYAKSKKMLDYFAQYPGRWGDSGSERCYDGLASFQVARVSAAASLDIEVCEIGQSFFEYASAVVTINIPCAGTVIAPEIDGVKTEAWHAGVYGAGYTFVCKSEIYNYGLVLSGVYQEFRDVSVMLYANNQNGIAINGSLGIYRNLFVYAISGGASSQAGISINGNGCVVENNVIANIRGTGVNFTQYNSAANTVSGNLVVKCTSGFVRNTSGGANYIFNNMAVGNTTNWGAQPSGLYSAGNNYGESGDSPWYVGTDTSIKTLTADNSTFADYANNDFRPASASAPQVDNAAVLSRMRLFDIGGKERPNYNNGDTEGIDGGPFEYDHGYGDHPITASLTLTGLVSGTDVVVRSAGTSTILDSVDSTSGNWTYTYGSAHNVDIDVIKPGMVIVTFRNLALTAAGATLPVSQQYDRNYS